MPRIRTIKPEFWTDEKIVSLPFEARLLFIGLWNFADDVGALDYRPERISMQIFPGNQEINVAAMLDLLEAAELIEFWDLDDNRVIKITHWDIHQKIDNPSRKTVLREGYRKLAIPSEARQGVARKYGCLPGEKCAAECYYCGDTGEIVWWKLYNGKPSWWISFVDLELDHFKSEHSGGDNSHKNLVLACRKCNRRKRDFDPLQFMIKKNELASPIEPSTLERKGKDQGKECIKPTCPISSDEQSWSERIYQAYPRHEGRRKALQAIQGALKRIQNETGGTIEPTDAGRFLLEKTTVYARSPAGQRGQFVPHPTTWYNQGRYLDDEQEWFKNRDDENKTPANGPKLFQPGAKRDMGHPMTQEEIEKANQEFKEMQKRIKSGKKPEITAPVNGSAEHHSRLQGQIKSLSTDKSM